MAINVELNTENVIDNASNKLLSINQKQLIVTLFY